MNISEFFKNKKSLVVGASGFIGRNLFELLKKNNVNVVGTYCSTKTSDFIHCDHTNINESRLAVDGMDCVFLLAAKTYGANVMKNNPTDLVTDSLIMNANILQACYEKKVKKVFYLSSGTIYQESYKSLTEEDLDLNKDPYPLYQGVGWVKRYTEQLCKFYSQLGLQINIVRPTDIYGPYERYEEGKSHFIPATIKKVLEGQNPLIVWGNGYSIKDVIYIDDFLRDCLKVFMYHNSIEPLNICSMQEYTIRDIVNTILQISGKTYEIEVKYDTTKPSSIPYRRISRNKFDSLYGKESYITLAEGLKKVYKWMKSQIGEKNVK